MKQSTLSFVIPQVIGIMAIEMAGCVYCPLSPGDPEQRLHKLIEQTDCRLVLVHWMTLDKFNDSDVTCDIDAVINSNHTINNDSLDL